MQPTGPLDAPLNGGAARGGQGHRLVVFAYFLSGLTCIAYEVLWVRMLTLQFGASIFGVVLTVSAFMAGLGLGSLLGARFGYLLRSPLLWCAALEAAVAGFALLMPAIFQWLEPWLDGFTGGANLAQWHGLQGGASFLLLFLPALAMGAGFSLILRGLAGAPVTLAKLYGLNTLGGVLGALLPLLLLPTLGWTPSLQLIVVFGVAVAVLIAWGARSMPPVNKPAPLSFDAGVRPPIILLLSYAGVGASALILQVGWTRLYGMVLLRTEYVLAVILAVFLLGIGVGSLLARRAFFQKWFIWLPPLAGLFALLSLWGLPALAGWADRQQFGSLWAALFWQGLALAVLTFPTTLMLGAWLPLLSERIAAGKAITGAWLYGANAVGAAVGAIVGGLVLVPWIGTTALIGLAALLVFVCGMGCITSRRSWWAMPVLIAAAVPVLSFPPVSGLLPVTQARVKDLALYEDALSITHVVEQEDGQRLLLADLQRMDASSDPVAVVGQQNQARLPLLLHENPRSVLFLGLGTGISAAGALPFPNISITAVELSEGAISAAKQWFAPVNADVMRRARVVNDDARRFLRADTENYDVIVGDLFHPDLIGRGNLLSVQQFQRARDHLAPDGVFVQWLALNQFDPESLVIVLRSFRRVFPEAQLFVEGFRLALVGPRDRWLGAPAMLNNLARMSAAEQAAVTGGEGPWTWLGRYWGPIPDSRGPLQDEWRPKIEFKLPQARYAGTFDLGSLLDLLLRWRLDLDAAALALRIEDRNREAFERAFVGSELVMRSWLASLRGDPYEGQRLLRAGYEANRQDRWIASTLLDQMLASLPQALQQGRDERDALQTLLAIHPEHVGVLRALWHLERREEHLDEAEHYRRRLLSLSPLDREANMIAAP